MAERIKIKNGDKLLFRKVAESRVLPASGARGSALRGACLVPSAGRWVTWVSWCRPCCSLPPCCVSPWRLTRAVLGSTSKSISKPSTSKQLNKIEIELQTLSFKKAIAACEVSAPP